MSPLPPEQARQSLNEPVALFFSFDAGILQRLPNCGWCIGSPAGSGDVTGLVGAEDVSASVMPSGLCCVRRLFACRQGSARDS